MVTGCAAQRVHTEVTVVKSVSPEEAQGTVTVTVTGAVHPDSEQTEVMIVTL